MNYIGGRKILEIIMLKRKIQGIIIVQGKLQARKSRVLCCVSPSGVPMVLAGSPRAAAWAAVSSSIFARLVQDNLRSGIRGVENVVHDGLLLKISGKNVQEKKKTEKHTEEKYKKL